MIRPGIWHRSGRHHRYREASRETVAVTPGGSAGNNDNAARGNALSVIRWLAGNSSLLEAYRASRMRPDRPWVGRIRESPGPCRARNWAA